MIVSENECKELPDGCALAIEVVCRLTLNSWRLVLKAYLIPDAGMHCMAQFPGMVTRSIKLHAGPSNFLQFGTVEAQGAERADYVSSS